MNSYEKYQNMLENMGGYARDKNESTIRKQIKKIYI